MTKLLRVFKYIVVIPMLTIAVYGQHFTTVTATLQDTASQTWGSATVIMSFQQTPGVPGPFLNQGVPVTNTPQTTVANSSGTFSFSVDSNDTVTPSGSKWVATVCSNTSAICSSFVLNITGTNINISSMINPFLPPPIVNATPTILRAYNDTEVLGGNGAIYWRTSDNSLRGCQALPNGACTWIAIGGTGGSGTVTQLNPGTGITLSPNPITTTGSISITPTISAGSCTSCNITYNAQGQITIAANGSGGGNITGSVSGTINTLPIFTGTTSIGNSQVTEVSNVLTTLDNTLVFGNTTNDTTITNTAANNKNLLIQLQTINNNSTNGAGIFFRSASNNNNTSQAAQLILTGGASGGQGGGVQILGGSNSGASGGQIDIEAGNGGGAGGPGSVTIVAANNSGFFGYGNIIFGHNDNRPGILRIIPASGNNQLQLMYPTGGSGSYALSFPASPPGLNQYLADNGTATVYGITVHQLAWKSLPTTSGEIVQGKFLSGCVPDGTTPCTFTYTTPYTTLTSCVCTGIGGSCNITSVNTFSCAIVTTVVNNYILTSGTL